MIGRIRGWWRKRHARRLDKAADKAEGIREGREVWEENRYGLQSGRGGSGRPTSYDEGKTHDDWS